MNVDEILEGLEETLALERELGVRTIACDRALLKPMAAAAPSPAPTPPPHPQPHPLPHPQPHLLPQPQPQPSPAPSPSAYGLVFLHDRPLSAKGIEMMAKILTAMGTDGKRSPIVFTGERPPARIYVVLGGNALRKWFPGVNAAPGQWIAADGANEILVTYSPEYILRFGVVTPAVQEIKKKMWTSLKGALQRQRGI